MGATFVIAVAAAALAEVKRLSLPRSASIAQSMAVESLRRLVAELSKRVAAQPHEHADVLAWFMSPADFAAVGDGCQDA